MNYLGRAVSILFVTSLIISSSNAQENVLDIQEEAVLENTVTLPEAPPSHERVLLDSEEYVTKMKSVTQFLLDNVDKKPKDNVYTRLAVLISKNDWRAFAIKYSLIFGVPLAAGCLVYAAIATLFDVLVADHMKDQAEAAIEEYQDYRQEERYAAIEKGIATEHYRK